MGILMPVKRSTKNGKPCYKTGETGKCYTYKAGDKASRERAKKKAIKQELAIARSQNREPHL